jgi:hypothetical protein
VTRGREDVREGVCAPRWRADGERKKDAMNTTTIETMTTEAARERVPAVMTVPVQVRTLLKALDREQMEDVIDRLTHEQIALLDDICTACGVGFEDEEPVPKALLLDATAAFLVRRFLRSLTTEQKEEIAGDLTEDQIPLVDAVCGACGVGFVDDGEG